MNDTKDNTRNAGRLEKKAAITWLFRHLIRFPYIAVIFFLSVVASVYFQTMSSVYLGKVFETLKSDGNRTLFLQAVSLVLLMLAGGALLQWVSSLSILKLRLKMERVIRSEIFTAFLNKKQDFMNTVRTGDLLAIGTNELRSISVMFQPGLNMSLRSILFYVLPLGVIFTSFSWQLWILPLLVTSISIMLLIRYARNINSTTSKARQQFGKMNADLNETIEGIEIIKSHLQETKETERFEQNVEQYAEHSWARALIEAKYLPTLVFHLFFSAAFLQGLLLYQMNELTMGQVVTYMGLFMAIGTPVANAEITFGFIGMGLASAERILKAIKDGASAGDKELALDSELVMQGAIEFQHISFEMSGGRKVLQDISFSAKAGDTVAIVGATGSGKSLLTKLVNRSFEATEGSIKIDGLDIKDWDLFALRSQIGIIEQDVFLYSWTVRDNIAFANPSLSDEDVKYYAELACAHTFIEQLEHGYDTRIGERGIHLSGGQRQRIAMARAFASDPKILILDDSTSGLDSGTEKEVMNGIQNVRKGRTTLLITNRLPLIGRADHIILLSRGKAIAQGSHNELLRNSTAYRDLFAQKEVT